MTPMNEASSWPPVAAPPASWMRRHKLLAMGMGCFGLMVAGCLLVAAVLVAAGLAVRSTDAYQLALSTATHDPSVVAELGAPVRAGWITTGRVTVTGSTGDANLAIPIAGPRNSGTINVSASKSAGKWTFSVLNVDIASRPTAIDLLAKKP